MRVWDVDPALLCRKHLLGEHLELHAIWSVLVNGKAGYSKHPETLRWRGKLRALYNRHERLVSEMSRRGYRHGSPLDEAQATGPAVQDEFIDLPDAQVRILTEKPCPCFSADPVH